MKFASRPDFITVKKSVMKLNQDGEPVGSADDEAKQSPPQMDAPTRVRPFSVGKLRDLVEQAKEQQKASVAPSSTSIAAVVTTKPAVRASASTSLLRTPVKMSVVAAIGVLVFAGVVSAIALIPKPEVAAAQPPPVVAAAATTEAVVAPAPPASGAGFVFTEPVVLLPGAPAEGTVAAAPAAAKPVEKIAEKPPERHRPTADKPAPPPPVAAKGPEAKPDPKAPPAGSAAANEMDEMRRIQQMANSQLDKSIH